MSSVKDNAGASRYEMEVEGQLAFADYRLSGKEVIINHVETPPALRGKGVAAELMKGIVADATKRGLSIVPVCPYAVTYLQRHPQNPT